MTYGVAAALQIISNLNNENPTMSHMTRAPKIIELYHSYNTRHNKKSPPIDVTSNCLSTLHAVEVVSSCDVFHGDEYPPQKASVNFQLQVSSYLSPVISL